MRFGILLPSELRRGASGAEQVASLREVARCAAGNGFESVWALHHYVSNVPTLQPIPLLSSLVDVTPGMTLGTGVLVLPLVHPVVVAEAFASLDVLSGGRAVMGVAAGYWEPEFGAVGVPFRGRVARLERSIDIVRRLWQGEEVTSPGEVHAVERARISLLPSQPGGPPIWMGGVSEPAIARAARLGDAWLLPPDLDARALSWRIERYHHELDAAGRRITVLPAQRECLLASTREEARRDAYRYLRQNAEIYAGRGMDWIEEQFERWFENSYMLGTPEHACTMLEQLQDLGVTEVHLRVSWGECPLEIALRTIELVGREVIPHFAGSTIVNDISSQTRARVGE